MKKKLVIKTTPSVPLLHQGGDNRGGGKPVILNNSVILERSDRISTPRFFVALRMTILLICAIAFFSTTTISFASSTTSRITLPLTSNSTLVLSTTDSTVDKKIIISDHLSSTRVILNEDGTESSSLSYYPYGEQFNNLTPLRPRLREGAAIYQFNNRYYTGQRKIPGDNLYNYNARFYNPTLGVFTQPDTVEGPNRFVYVKNNPISKIDPTGNACWDINFSTCANTASAFIKFNIGIPFAKFTGSDLAAETVTHFLYGNGETINISDDYQRAFIESTSPSLPYNEMSSDMKDTILSQNLGGIISSMFKLDDNDRTLGRKISTNDTDLINLSSSRSLTFSGRTVVDSYQGRELNLSLGKYTVNFSGQVTSAELNEGMWNLILSESSISIYDYYDWDRDNGLLATGSLMDITPQRLKDRAYDLLGSDRYNSIFTKSIATIHDSDGALLMDEKIGIGKPFAITGNFKLSSPLMLKIHESYLHR